MDGGIRIPFLQLSVDGHVHACIKSPQEKYRERIPKASVLLWKQSHIIRNVKFQEEVQKWRNLGAFLVLPPPYCRWANPRESSLLHFLSGSQAVPETLSPCRVASFVSLPVRGFCSCCCVRDAAGPSSGTNINCFQMENVCTPLFFTFTLFQCEKKTI